MAAQIVMPAVSADEPARRISLQPLFMLAAVPDSVLRSQHPAMSLAVEHGEIAHREPECSRLQIARAPVRDQRSISRLGLGEWIDRHRDSIARDGMSRSARRWGVESIGTGRR